MLVRGRERVMMSWWEGMRSERRNEDLMSDWMFLVINGNVFLLLWLENLNLSRTKIIPQVHLRNDQSTRFLFSRLSTKTCW